MHTKSPDNRVGLDFKNPFWCCEFASKCGEFRSACSKKGAFEIRKLV